MTLDAVPIFSQIKSLIQLATGNSKGALETQINFAKRCPVVSQLVSLGQAISGDEKGAIETQATFLEGINGTVNSVPGLGHIKGGVHYIFGDKEGGDKAMKAATHTTGVVAGGVGGFLVGGPAGAAVGGVMGGTYTDTIISTVGIATGDTNPLYGVYDNILHIIEDPKEAGNYVDLIGGVVLDGVTGCTTGTAVGKNIQNKLDKRSLANAVGNEATKDIIDAGESMKEFRVKNKIKGKKPHVITRAKDRVTGKTATGHNKQMRQDPIIEGPTELQKRVPDAKQVLPRSVRTCAEQEAYNGVYKRRPSASPGDLTSVSVRIDSKSQRIFTVPRCKNCKEFIPAMGTVYTDMIPETVVPLGMGVGATVAMLGTGIGINALEKSYEKSHKSKSHKSVRKN